MRAASNVAFRYFRIRAALEAFTQGNQTDDCHRRRWRIGLYREVVSFPILLILPFPSNAYVARVQARRWGAYDLGMHWRAVFPTVKLSMVGFK